MAEVVITLKIMPESPESDLSAIKEEASALIAAHGGHVHKTEEVPVAFGLKALHIIFSMDEAKGSTESLEGEIAKVEGVQSVDCIDARRAFG